MKKIFDKFSLVFIIFLYLQPLLDVSAGILMHFGYSITISSIIRLLFMFMSILYLVFKIKNKKINTYLFILLTYFILYIVTVLIYKGVPALTYELKNLITTYYFVIELITLVSLYKNNTFKIKHLFTIYIIYLLLVFIPNIFNIGFNSYWHSKDGSSGWFSSANVIGSILSILLPILIINIKKINMKLIILLQINLYVIFSIGTKVPVLAFLLIIFINIIYYLIYLFKKKEYKILSIISIPIIILITSMVVVIPKTTFYKNIVIHINFLEKKDNGNITMNHYINHFIFSQRLTFEEKTRKAYNKASTVEKLIGIGYIENYATDNVRLKTIEMDYFDIFYRHGIFGFILFFTPLIYVTKHIISNFKYKHKEKLNIILVLVLIFSLALFQGHIFMTPNISIFVAFIMSLIYNNYEFKTSLS